MDSSKTLWSLTQGNSPILATAIHHGHHVRPDAVECMLVDSRTRLREEDPYTAELTTIVDNRLVVHHSRFEMDMNRDRNNAVYLTPEDAWGITVWQHPVPNAVLNQSLKQYDAFYQMLQTTLNTMVRRHLKVAVLDFHSYNHHRMGPEHPFDSTLKNPEIEIGTDTMDQKFWAPVVDRFITDLRQHDFRGRQLDVRENVKFGAGWMSQWIHNHFPQSVCTISVELKKTYMDEWTGKLFPQVLNDYRQAFLAAVPGLIHSLKQMRHRSQ